MSDSDSENSPMGDQPIPIDEPREPVDNTARSCSSPQSSHHGSRGSSPVHPGSSRPPLEDIPAPPAPEQIEERILPRRSTRTRFPTSIPDNIYSLNKPRTVRDMEQARYWHDCTGDSERTTDHHEHVGLGNFNCCYN